MTITINDNDHVPVELSWEQSSFNVDEDVGTVTLTAQRSPQRWTRCLKAVSPFALP